MKYKDSETTIPEIGKDLNVAHVLESSIRKSGDKIRVTAQLINTDDRFQIWSQDFDRTLDDIFDIQDDISEKIASALLATLSPEDKKNSKTKRPISIEAYEEYIRGRYFHSIYWQNGDQKDFLLSESKFKSAIKLDPNFSDSYANIANLYNTRYYYLPDTSNERQKYMQLQEAYLDSAKQLDPNSAEVNHLNGMIYMARNKYKEAFNSLKTAITINPNNYSYYRSTAVFLNETGCLRLTMMCYDRAIELNPLDSFPYLANGIFHMIFGEIPEAERSIHKAFEIDSTIQIKVAYLLLLKHKEEYETAKEYIDKLRTEYQDKNFDYQEATIYAINGQSKKALNKIESFSWMQKMFLFSLLDFKDESINEIQQMSEYYQKHEKSLYLTLLYNPYLENMRSHPRFADILALHKKLYEENLAKYGDIDI